MSLDPTVALVVLLAALLHASWNALVKAVPDRLLTMAVIQLTGMVVGIAAIPLLPLPLAASWPLLALSTLLHVAYQIFLLLGYRAGDLSQVYPVARGLGPPLAALLAIPLLGEHLSREAAAGVAIVSAGLIGLAFARGGVGLAGVEPLAYAGANGIVIAAYTLTDAAGARLAGNSWSYIAWLSVLDGPTLVGYFLWRRGPGGFAGGWRRLQPGVFGGLLTVAAYALVLWAYRHGPVAPVAALRETSVIFAALIGSRLLGEPFGRRRLTAAVVVALGAVLINLG